MFVAGPNYPVVLLAARKRGHNAFQIPTCYALGQLRTSQHISNSMTSPNSLFSDNVSGPERALLP